MGGDGDGNGNGNGTEHNRVDNDNNNAHPLAEKWNFGMYQQRTNDRDRERARSQFSSYGALVDSDNKENQGQFCGACSSDDPLFDDLGNEHIGKPPVSVTWSPLSSDRVGEKARRVGDEVWNQTQSGTFVDNQYHTLERKTMAMAQGVPPTLLVALPAPVFLSACSTACNADEEPHLHEKCFW